VQTQKQAIHWELLVIRCQRGDPEAFPELIDAWERPLLYYIRQLIGAPCSCAYHMIYDESANPVLVARLSYHVTMARISVIH
jgi:hypothetical protein